MKLLSVLFSALIALAPDLSSASTLWQRDANAPSSREALTFCSNLNWDSKKQECISLVSENFIDGVALNYCQTESGDSNQISCLRRTANHSYAREAFKICSSLRMHSMNCIETIADSTFQKDALKGCEQRIYNEASKVRCLKNIANKSYDPAELHSCFEAGWDGDKADCLGYKGVPQHQLSPAPRMEDVIVDILLDAIDQAFRDSVAQRGIPSRGDVCRLENSNGRFLGEIAKADLAEVGSQFARDQQSCVVTNVKGTQRTRTLFGAHGQVLGEKLTEKEASELKNYYGFERCRVVTCVR